jgi:peptide/nickel transport system substrate-binding protein
MLALTGEVDFLRENASLARLAEYKQAQEKAGFQVVLLRAHIEPICLVLNQTYDDPNWRKLVSDIRFRQAVSLAINRQEIIDSLYYGYAALPLKTVGEQYSRYDVAQANRLLDELGLARKNEAGYRLYEDGSEVEIWFEHGLSIVVFAPASELLAAYLKDIGLKVNVKQIDHNLLVSRLFTNQLQMTFVNSRGAGMILQISPLWDQWLSRKGTQGEEPPQWIKDLITLQAEKWVALPNSAAYQELTAAEYRWVRDNLPFINFVEDAKQPLLVNRRLGNIPSSASTAYANAANFSVVQMYYKP